MGILEVTPIFDVFCSGISNVEILPGDLLRVWCYAEQASNGGDGPAEQVLVAKIVIPASAMSAAIELASAAVARKRLHIWPKPRQIPPGLMGLMAATLAVSLIAGGNIKSRIGGDHLIRSGGYGEATTFVAPHQSDRRS